ncbi:DNA-directed DNA polymerase [Tanacetum coccineum]
MSIQLADQSIKYPIVVCEILLVKISKFIFPIDFVVLEMDEDELVLIILGRLFLATARAIIDVHKGKLSLRVGSKTVTFNIGKSTKSKHFCDDYLYCADHTTKLVHEQWVDTLNHEGKWTKEEEEENSNEAFAVSFYLRTEPVEPLEWKALENRLKPSSVEPPKLELKELPKHLECAFLQENNQLPMVISSALSIVEKSQAPRDLGKLTKAEIRDLFPEEWLMAISDKNNEPYVLTESYEDAWPEMRQHKFFDNVTADHLEDIMTSQPPQEKSSRLGFTGHISSKMHGYSLLQLPNGESNEKIWSISPILSRISPSNKWQVENTIREMKRILKKTIKNN